LEERRRELVVVALPDAGVTAVPTSLVRQTIAYALSAVYKTDIVIREPNKGIEGIAYDARRGDLYAAVEKWPMRVLRVDRTAGIVTELFDATAKLSGAPAYLTDLAGLAYEPRSQMLLVLSHEQRKVVSTMLDGTVLSALVVGDSHSRASRSSLERTSC
jgi:uncharacterized protein YjiK